MSDYIVCRKKRNAPRLSVRVCQERCTLKNKCNEYVAYLKVPIKQEQHSVSPENTPVTLTPP
jgi:hypothetical protein